MESDQTESDDTGETCRKCWTRHPVSLEENRSKHCTTSSPYDACALGESERVASLRRSQLCDDGLGRYQGELEAEQQEEQSCDAKQQRILEHCQPSTAQAHDCQAVPCAAELAHPVAERNRSNGSREFADPEGNCKGRLAPMTAPI